jgi:hypothetical protein
MNEGVEMEMFVIKGAIRPVLGQPRLLAPS